MRIDLIATEACAWPVLVRLPGGRANAGRDARGHLSERLGLVYFNRPSHGLEEGDLATLVSEDEGVSWRSAGIAAPHEPGANRMHIASGVDHAGRWIVLSSGLRLVDGKHAGLERVWCSTRDDVSGAWTVNREVDIQNMDTRVIPHGRILALDGGRLAATFYLSHGRGNPSRAWIAFSDDGGASWAGARLVAGGDANEVVLLRAGDGTLLAAVRTHVDHHVALHASVDGGRSWTFRCDLTLPMQHPADLDDLGERGILATFGIRNRGLMGIGARLSRDQGRTWSAPVVLTQFGEAADCGYPSTIALAGGELLTACYSDLSAVHDGYHLLALRWRFEEFFDPRPLRSISDGGPLRV